MANTVIQKSQSGTTTPNGPTTSGSVQVFYQARTTAGSLLLIMIEARQQTSVNPSPVAPSLSAPITSDGSTWVLVGQKSVGPSSYVNSSFPFQTLYCSSTIALYCIFNAPSKAAYPTVELAPFTCPSNVLPSGDFCDVTSSVWEINVPANSIVDAFSSNSGVGNTPSTANLATTADDFIYSATAFIGSLLSEPNTGPGFTRGITKPRGFATSVLDEYMTDAGPGSVPVTYATGDPLSAWAVIAAAFGPGSIGTAASLLAFYRLDGSLGHDAEVPSGSVNGSNVTFSLAFAPNPAASLFLYKNGNFMVQGTDYTLGMSPGSSIGVITMAKAPASGDHLIAWYRSDGGTLGIADNEIPLGVIDGINPDFTLAHSALAGTLVLFQRKGDGSGCVSLAPTGIDYTNAGTLILMATPPAVGDTLRAFYRYTPPAG